MGRTREYRMRVTEPEPGRVLTESDMNSNLVTTFTVTPQNAASRVEIYTPWKGAAGIGGARAGLRYPGHARHLRPMSWSASTPTRVNARHRISDRELGGAQERHSSGRSIQGVFRYSA